MKHPTRCVFTRFLDASPITDDPTWRLYMAERRSSGRHWGSHIYLYHRELFESLWQDFLLHPERWAEAEEKGNAPDSTIHHEAARKAALGR